MTDTEVVVSSIVVEVHMRSNNYGLDGRFTLRLVSNGRHRIKIRHQIEVLSNLTLIGMSSENMKNGHL